MSSRTLFFAPLLAFTVSLPGCHYWIDATPKIIISSEPFEPRAWEACPVSPRPSAGPTTEESAPPARQSPAP